MAAYRAGTKQLHLIKESALVYDASLQGDAVEEEVTPKGLSDAKQAWAVDQLAKSEFFHQKLHEWGMLEVANLIDQVKSEDLAWEVDQIGLTSPALSCKLFVVQLDYRRLPWNS